MQKGSRNHENIVSVHRRNQGFIDYAIRLQATAGVCGDLRTFKTNACVTFVSGIKYMFTLNDL